MPDEKSKMKARDLLSHINYCWKYLNTSGGRTVEYARNCITSLNLFVHNLVVLFNDILDSFAEGNEFLQRYVICLKSIELNKHIVSEIEKGGKNSLKKFWVALTCWIRREKKERKNKK